jgi:hypothetical protein
MTRHIIRLEDHGQPYYLEWSAELGCPVTEGMTRQEFQEYYRQEYGRSGMSRLVLLMLQVDQFGTSEVGARDVNDTIARNSAGPEGVAMTKAQLVSRFVRLPRRPRESVACPDAE